MKNIFFLTRLCVSVCLLCITLACNNVNERNNGDTPFVAQNEETTKESNLTQIAFIKNDNPHEYCVTKVYVVKHDGCEYLMAVGYTWDSRGGNSLAITHSASCNNPIHGNNTTDE